MALGAFRYSARWRALRSIAMDAAQRASLEDRDREIEDYLSSVGVSIDALRALSGIIIGDGAGGFTADAAPLSVANGGTNTTTAGTGSGYDADLLDGQEGSYYLDATNHTGAVQVRVRRTTDQSINDSSLTTISFATEDSDTANMHSSGTFTIGKAGWWAIQAKSVMAVQIANRYILQASFADGSGTLPTGLPTTLRNVAAPNEDENSLTLFVPLAVGNTFTIDIYHTHGSAQNLTSAWCGARWVGP